MHLLDSISHIKITTKGAIKETTYPQKHVLNNSKWRKKSFKWEKKIKFARLNTNGTDYLARIERERERESRVRLGTITTLGS